MSWYEYSPYVSAAERKAKALKKIAKLSKAGNKLSPVTLTGRAIANTFWGKAWCRHLESCGDYENRLPRGRTYVRNGSVIDLQISPGKIVAQIMGSSHYHGTVLIEPLSAPAWEKIKAECAGQIDSVIELLQGKFSKSVMEIISRPDSGLFPKVREIKLDCSCPDYASLCKHLAAVLYGVGARLDTEPELLFILRGVDHLELITGAVSTGLATGPEDSGLDDNLSSIFGIEIADAPPMAPPSKAPLAPKKKAQPAAKKKKPVKKPKAVKKTKVVKKPKAVKKRKAPKRT